MRTKKICIAFIALAVASMACTLDSIQAPEPQAPPPPPAQDIPASPVPPPTVAVEKELSAVMDTADSGSLCPNGPTPVDNGDTPSALGERNDFYECEGYWTFDIQAIPPTSSVLSAFFLPGTCTTFGSPFSFGDLGFELVDFGNLDIGDYGNGGVGKFQGGEVALLFKNCTPGPIDITNYVKSEAKKGAKVIQIRAYVHPGNFSNGVDDYVSFRTGYIPTIVIRYK